MSPQYFEPYLVVYVIGPVAYRVKLPPTMVSMHDVFHNSMLWQQKMDLLVVVEL